MDKGVSPTGAGLSPTVEPLRVSPAAAASIPDADEPRQLAEALARYMDPDAFNGRRRSKRNSEAAYRARKLAMKQARTAIRFMVKPGNIDRLMATQAAKEATERTLAEPVEQAAPVTFEREDRYIVVKRSHISPYSQECIEKAIFSAVCKEVEWNGHRHLLNNDGQVACVVVEKDWPEYEPVWKMIEARVTGLPSPHPAATAALAQGIDAQSATTAGRGPQDESPVSEGNAPENKESRA